jgi:hypothetical protein
MTKEYRFHGTMDNEAAMDVARLLWGLTDADNVTVWFKTPSGTYTRVSVGSK